MRRLSDACWSCPKCGYERFNPWYVREAWHACPKDHCRPVALIPKEEPNP
jgi:hypothetical protein